jgi:fructose-bisphosphate aldolase class II
MDNYEPIPGNVMYDSLKNEKCIIMACNTRIVPGVCKGIMRAAKDLNAPIIFELARSEMNLEGGYTGITPSDYGRMMREVALDVQHDCWVLHADHITIKNGDEEEMASTKELINGHIDAGFTSFAIDASHIFDFDGQTVREELAGNIKVTTEIAEHITSKMGDTPFGLEVEVGEIGRKGDQGAILTSPEEAVTFITALKENGVKPHILAIANGSTHGNIYDEHGKLIPQSTVDIEQTRAVVNALREANTGVRVAQHGITGTPRGLIKTEFPKGDILKGNVGTFWQNIVWDVLKDVEPGFFSRIEAWVEETYRPNNPNKSKEELFGLNSKYAIKQFYDEIYGLDQTVINIFEAEAYAQSLIWIKTFSTEGMAKLIRENP